METAFQSFEVVSIASADSLPRQPRLSGAAMMVAREMRPHQEETEVVDLGISSGLKEVKIGTGMTAPVREELMVLLKNYQDIFAWSYQDMPGLSSDIVQHRLPLNPECSPIKQKLRRINLSTWWSCLKGL